MSTALQPKLKRRGPAMAREKLARVVLFFCAFLVAGSLAAIVGAIAWKGAPSLSLEMMTTIPKGGFYLGKEGGIFNAILGTLYLATGATLLAFVVSLPLVLYVNVLARQSAKSLGLVRMFQDVLWGVPSVVYGSIGFLVMLSLGMKATLGMGILVVGVLVVPIMVRSMDEAMKRVPMGLLEAGDSLGATRWETAWRIALPKALPGLATAVLLRFGRAAGDAAAVLFVAGLTDNLPAGLDRPAATLPLSIFFQLSSPVPEVRSRAYASALVLTVLVLLISLFARGITKQLSKNTA